MAWEGGLGDRAVLAEVLEQGYESRGSASAPRAAMHPAEPWCWGSQVRCGLHDPKVSSTHMWHLQYTMPQATDSHWHLTTNPYAFRGTLRPQTLPLLASQSGPRWKNDYMGEPSLRIQVPGQGDTDTQIHLGLPDQGKRST